MNHIDLRRMPTRTDVLPAMLSAAVTRAEDPLLTYCDDATGERMELSATDLGGWASRTCDLLRQGCGLGVGARVAVALPPHWQTAAVLLGTWSAGSSVSFRLWATAGLAVHEPGGDEPLDAAFVARSRVDSWLDDAPEARHRFVLGLETAPLDEVPAGYRDFLAEVTRHSDSLPPRMPAGSADAASVEGTTFRQWGSLARELATSWGIGPGDRLLIDVAQHEHPVTWLLAPLSAGASVVLCANLDPAKVDARAAAEGVTRVL